MRHVPGTLPEDDSFSDSQDHRVRRDRHCRCYHEEMEIPQVQRQKPARAATTRQKVVSLLFCYLLFCTWGPVGTEQRTAPDESDSDSQFWSYLQSWDRVDFWLELSFMMLGGGFLAMVLPALGFKSTGVATSSVASWLMSWSARANGGGVPAGGVVAMLQSLGATDGSSLLAEIGAILGYIIYKHIDN